MSWLTRTLCQCSLSLGLPISSFVGFTAQNFSDNFSEVWRRLFRIDTALNISEVIFVLLVTYLFRQSHICSVSHVFVLLVTCLFCQSRICSVGHVFVLLVTYLFCQSRICSVRHIFVLFVTYLFCQSHICSVSHTFVLLVTYLCFEQNRQTESKSQVPL